jgi:hypothetical protein
MIKKITLNRHSIPVPVPIRTGANLLGWLESTFLKPGHVITKLHIDGNDALDESDLNGLHLESNSKVEVQIDSPVDLALHSLDAVTSLGGVVLRGLKPLAVASWQTIPTSTPEGMQQAVADLQLLVDLGKHSLSLIDQSDPGTHQLLQNLSNLGQLVGLIDAEQDWQEVARILLNKIEPTLMSVCEQVSALQSTLFSNLSAETLQHNL